MFKVIAVDSNQVKLEFISKDGENFTFETYEEAESFMQKVKAKNTLPERYRVLIKKID
ncbi:hypothetical protein [Terribacillus halophilus]|jgi:hypothetical protein|uniref:hypothetical protein n=1 Tax=Terribacillus halophilus TaxID=361279 RepID=UPI0015C346A6|nr:hypothetical protein [Terribacillus halophilus]